MLSCSVFEETTWYAFVFFGLPQHQFEQLDYVPPPPSQLPPPPPLPLPTKAHKEECINTKYTYFAYIYIPLMKHLR